MLTQTGTISGWIVTFMTRYRHVSLSTSGACSSGFWIGMAAGRLALGFVTDKLGLRIATTIYFGLAIAAETIFTMATSSTIYILSAILLGFFCGPLFPNGVVLLIHHLPKSLHVRAVSFVASLGQVGAAILPFALGATSQHLGIQVFRVIIFGELIMTLLLWLCFAMLPIDGVGPQEHLESSEPPEQQA